MSYANLSTDFGIVVREASFAERDVLLRSLLQIFEVEAPYDHKAGLISFGPHSGQDAADAIFARLEAEGHRYADDFFLFAPEAPAWCSFGATASK